MWFNPPTTSRVFRASKTVFLITSSSILIHLALCCLLCFSGRACYFTLLPAQLYLPRLFCTLLPTQLFCRGFYFTLLPTQLYLPRLFCTLLPAHLFLSRLLFHSAMLSCSCCYFYSSLNLRNLFFQAILCGFYCALLEERKFTAVPVLYSDWFTSDSDFFITTLRLSFHQHSLRVICKVLSGTCY